MFEILLTLCLAADASACRTERYPGGDVLGTCRAEARALAAGLAATPDGPRPQAWPCVPEGTTPVFATTEIAPGVFVHKGAHAQADPGNGGDIANLGFVIGDVAVAAIDAGGSGRIGEALLAAIRAETDLPVSHLILTHMHPDHVLGAQVFAQAGAEIVGHRRLPEAWAARAESYLMGGARLVGPDFEGTRAVQGIGPAPDEIDLGGRRLVIEQHPTAHTDNDLTIYDVATGTWFLGDLLFVDHVPTLDGSILGWLSVMEALAAREVARAVPGHGPVAVAWPEAAGPMRAYLTRLAEETRAAIAAGTPMLEAIRSIGAESGKGWLLHPLFHAQNVSAAFRELEWE